MTCCEDVNNVSCCVLSWNVKCNRKMRFQIFLFAESISVNLFSWLCLIISSFMFQLFDSIFFEITNAINFDFFEMTETWRDESSSSTKATHQTRRKRLIKLDKQHLVKSDEFYLIKLDEQYFHQICWAILSVYLSTVSIRSHSIKCSEHASKLSEWKRYDFLELVETRDLL